MSQHRPTDLTDAVVRGLPKVELHVHLEGTLERERIAEMAADAGEQLPRPLDRLFELDDLPTFLDFLGWTCSLVRTPQVAAHLAYDFAVRAARDRILYAEVIVNPSHWRLWDLGQLVDALTAGFDRAEADGLTECHLLLSILREQSGEEALDLVEWMGKHRPRRVIGLSIDGDEDLAGRTGQRFAAAFERAGELGFGRTAHAGESSGPDGVRDALDLLHVDRIDHGVRAIDDPVIVQRLIDGATTLNICLSSNLKRLYHDVASHPFLVLHRAGVPVTLNTDDPGYVGVDLTGEFLMAARAAGWGLVELAGVTRRAIDAAFCPPTTAARLHAALDAYLAVHS